METIAEQFFFTRQEENPFKTKKEIQTSEHTSEEFEEIAVPVTNDEDPEVEDEKFFDAVDQPLSAEVLENV